MAAATLAMKVTAASVVTDRGSNGNIADGLKQLVLVVEATASSAAVPLVADSVEPHVPVGMVGKVLTLNYDDATGVITSLT